MKTMRSLTGLLAFGLLAAGCKNIEGPGAPPEDPAPASEGPTKIVVQIIDFAFVGPDGTDAIQVVPGDTIEFVNRDIAPHTATTTSAPPGQAFDSGTLSQGESYIFIPAVEGAWSYLCDFHPQSMRGATITAAGAREGPPLDGEGTTPPGGADDGSGSGTGTGTGTGDTGTGGTGGSAGGSGSSGGAGGASGTITIDIRNFAYISPNGTDTVTIALGQTVEFVNSDDASHTATSSSAPAGDGFDSGRMRTGDRFRWTPTQTGTWVYDCTFHIDQMAGAVIRVVQGGGGSGGSGDGGSGGGSDAGGSGGSGAVVPITISGSGYAGPDGSTDVSITLGQTVEWVNADSEVHSVSSTDEPKGAADFDSGDLAPGAIFRFTPDQTGTWEYRCDHHGEERDMRIIVR